MGIKFKFNDNSMDLIMNTVRRLGCQPSEAVDILLNNPQLLIEVADGIRENRKQGRKTIIS